MCCWAYWSRRRLWFRERGILRRGRFARSPRYSRRRWTVELDNKAHVAVLQHCALCTNTRGRCIVRHRHANEMSVVPSCCTIACHTTRFTPCLIPPCCPFLLNAHHRCCITLRASCDFSIRKSTFSHIDDAASCKLRYLLIWIPPLLTRHIGHQWNVYRRQKKINGFQSFFTILYIPGTNGW